MCVQLVVLWENHNLAEPRMPELIKKFSTKLRMLEFEAKFGSN